MDQFTKQMKKAYKILKRLQVLVRSSIENGQPYTSEQHLQDLIDEFEVYFQQAYYDVDAEKDMQWRKRLHEKEETICALRSEIVRSAKNESLTFAEIDVAKTKLMVDRENKVKTKDSIVDNIYFGDSLTEPQKEAAKEMIRMMDSASPEAEAVLFDALKRYEERG